MSRYIHTDPNSRPASVAAGEREPEMPPIPVVCSGVAHASGSRLRYTVERGSGSAGTAYNKLDFEVLDHDAAPGRQVICRAGYRQALLIAAALNRM